MYSVQCTFIRMGNVLANRITFISKGLLIGPDASFIRREMSLLLGPDTTFIRKGSVLATRNGQ